MKKSRKIINSLIIITLIQLLNISAYASNGDSVNVTNADTSHEFSWYYLEGGIGISAFILNGSYESTLNVGPAVNIGFELPFNSSSIFSLAASSFYWIAQAKKNIEYDKPFYSQINNDLYSLFGFSVLLKCYLSGKSNNFRLSLHLGSLLFSSSYFTNGIEIGLGLNYFLNEKSFISLSLSNYIIGMTELFKARAVIPDLLFLNYYFNF